MDASWTISELSERVADALADGVEVPGGKARAIPDERAIRYYTTLGLLDRATLRGRTAYYGPRHLAQLIAIKRMQVDGASLAEIQELLPALDDAALSELTGVALVVRPRPAARPDFWRAGPVAAETASDPDPVTDSVSDTGSGPGPEDPFAQSAARAEASAQSLPPRSDEPALRETKGAAAAPFAPASFTAEHHLELAPGVRLSISASRVPSDADADALRVAAAAVLAELVRRRLVHPVVNPPRP